MEAINQKCAPCLFKLKMFAIEESSYAIILCVFSQ